VFFQIVMLLNFQGLGTFLKRVGLLDPDIVLRKTRIPNLVPEIRAMMVERFQLADATSASSSSSALATLSGVHGEVLALLDVMLQADQKRSSAAAILETHVPVSWKNDGKKPSMHMLIVLHLCFIVYYLMSL
jgi:hypothetical protein